MVPTKPALNHIGCSVSSAPHHTSTAREETYLSKWVFRVQQAVVLHPKPASGDDSHCLSFTFSLSRPRTVLLGSPGLLNLRGHTGMNTEHAGNYAHMQTYKYTRVWIKCKWLCLVPTRELSTETDILPVMFSLHWFRMSLSQTSSTFTVLCIHEHKHANIKFVVQQAFLPNHNVCASSLLPASWEMDVILQYFWKY